jgi:hypothetical protein
LTVVPTAVPADKTSRLPPLMALVDRDGITGS